MLRLSSKDFFLFCLNKGLISHELVFYWTCPEVCSLLPASAKFVSQIGKHEVFLKKIYNSHLEFQCWIENDRNLLNVVELQKASCFSTNSGEKQDFFFNSLEAF